MRLFTFHIILKPLKKGMNLYVPLEMIMFWITVLIFYSEQDHFDMACNEHEKLPVAITDSPVV